jgi:hypothetical protein
MVGAVKTARGVEGMQIIDPFYDPDAVISKAARGVKKEKFK